MADKVVKRIVIGAGYAGTAAALARPEGTLVVALGSGATGISSGAIDICGDPLAVPGKPGSTCTDIKSNISRLIKRNPLHPYSILTRGKDIDALFIEQLEPALEAIFPVGSELSPDGSLESNRPALTLAGTVKFTALSPQSTALANEPIMQNPLVIGISELLDFEPDFWLSSAKDALDMLGLKMNGRTAWVDLELGHEVQSIELARALLDEQTEDKLFKVLTDKLSGNEATALVFPPLLNHALRQRLEGEFGLPVRELLALTPSVPGFRLALHLEERIVQSSIELIRGRVIEARTEGDIIQGLTISTASGPLEIQAEDYILAAGSFIGGGLDKNDAFEEPLLGLPVFSGDTALGVQSPLKLTEKLIRRPQDLFACGLKVDDRLSPLDLDGNPVFNNLRAAGAILQGFNPAYDHSGAATAIATGWSAGSDKA